MKIRTLIIDDEPHAREGIRIRLARYPEIYIIGECASGSEAVTVIDSLQPDLLFLDIQMPEMNGFEVLRKIHITPQPIVIFVTAFDKYAIQAFECHALDYLLKPIREDRFCEALRVVLSESHRRNLEQYVAKLQSAASDYSSLTGMTAAAPVKAPAGARPFLTRLMIKAKDQISIVSVDKIDWIDSAGDYVYVHSQAQKHIVRETLVSLEERLDPRMFVRIHRSVIVNIEQITQLRPNDHGDYDVFLNSGVKLKLSRSYRPHFEQATGNLL
jgi:two-component system, LytTR family, response regulator